jgi:hypothetical protein
MAMMTRQAKSSGEIIPRSSPLLMMINSIRPLAFISTPIPIESRRLKPESLAAKVQATHLPTMAAKRIAKQAPRSHHALSKPIRVLRPE